MAWSFTDVDSDYQTWLAADYPMMAVQAIPVAPSYAKWVDDGQVGAGNITTWTDRSATASPAIWAYDGLPGYITEHSGVTVDDVYYYAVDAGSAITFDSVFLIGHNAGTLSLVNNLVLQIADDNAFSTSLTTVADFGTPSDDTRLADLSLSHVEDLGRAHDTAADAGPNQYTAQYFWLKWDKTGTNIIPEIGELWLAKRYQTRTNPLNPWDKDGGLHDEIARSRTVGGVTFTTVYHEDRYGLRVTFPAWQDARVADMKSWFTGARGSWIWIPEPSSAPDSWRIITKQPDFEMPSSDYTNRTTSVFGEEQGPEEYFLERET